MFLERKTKASTLEGFKLALRRQTISPALEKIHKKKFFTIRLAQWIRVPGYQNGYRVRVFIRVPGYPFRALDRGKGNTRHRPRHTTRPTGNEPGRAGPKFGSSARARPGPARQENWNFQARPAGRPARSQL